MSTSNYVQFERTRNTRLKEGRRHRIFDTKNTGFGTTKLDDFPAHSEVSVPFDGRFTDRHRVPSGPNSG